MLKIKHFTALQKMPHFQDLQTGHGGTKYSVPPQRDQKYYCESKETYQFRAKLFFKGNWVGGFYWDSLLNLCDKVPEYNLNPLEPKNLLKILMILNMVIAINW